MVQMMAVFAEMERDAISKRTKEALAAAKARGVKLGNPRLAKARAEINTARQEAADAFAASVLPIIREIQASGISSPRGVAKALSTRGVKTARGGAWTAVQVGASWLVGVKRVFWGITSVRLWTPTSIQEPPKGAP
jgi:hypothetical protein